MRRAALVFAVWGVWLGVWTAAQLLFLHATLPEQTIQWVMLGGASAAALLTGAAVGRAGPRHEGAAQLITNESVASATVAVGLAILLVGTSFGAFLLMIGGGVTLLGVTGVLREERARRRLGRRRTR